MLQLKLWQPKLLSPPSLSFPSPSSPLFSFHSPLLPLPFLPIHRPLILTSLLSPYSWLQPLLSTLSSTQSEFSCACPTGIGLKEVGKTCNESWLWYMNCTTYISVHPHYLCAKMTLMCADICIMHWHAQQSCIVWWFGVFMCIPVYSIPL